MSTVFDTAVIGAGMAGLTAARDLAVQGKKVILLEARDRIGGRVYRPSALGGELEVGGGYMNWTQPIFWHELCRHGMAELNPPLGSVKMYWLADGVVHQGTKEEYQESALIPTLKAFGAAGSLFPVPFDATAPSAA
ncbi:hypothetical protein NLG97_g11089 [Lecanicillium saksenae]|uniref:Uncharacterized protein n=1 Tax=Lecanicillium saksenae TaxID=468837 RepID=A0ACC1QBW3_9HYPO|nr:hypothetical protein NLG97_g11089 [Lecanicillium saksenae]